MEICTVGGYEEVGKNMTAVKVGDDVVLFDAGFHLPSVIELQENEVVQHYTEKKLRNVGALPDDLVLDKMGWTDKVKAILIGHAHLDHIGAIPYIAQRYPNATIMATPFTMAVIESILEDEKIIIKNPKKVVQENSIHKIGKDMQAEFIHTTHSTLQCAFIALHTKDGVFFYGLDFKFDNHPTMGNPPNYKRMREIARKGVKAMVVDAIYSGTEKKSGGEAIAKQLLQEAFSRAYGDKNAFFITTFSSHIERLNSIVEFANKTNREIIFLGRSLNKYVNSAIKVKLCPFAKKIKLVKYRRQINSILSKVDKNRGKYLIVCTGHQAEKGSILDRIVKGETPFKFKSGDNLIFSSSVIPVQPNMMLREKLDKKLRAMGVKIQVDVHVHGHGSREDLREMIQIVKPKHIIPAHGSLEQEAPLIDLASEFGYKFGETSHLSSNGKLLKF